MVLTQLKKKKSIMASRRSLNSIHNSQIDIPVNVINFHYFNPYNIKNQKICNKESSLSLKLKMNSLDIRKIIPDEDIWKVEAILGSKYVEQKLLTMKCKNIDKIDKNLIIEWFKESKINFYVTLINKNLLSCNQGIWEKYGPFRIISAYQALKDYGINKMEIASERGIVNL